MQNKIHVQDFHGDRVIDNHRDLVRTLALRYGDDANLFTLSRESLDYPLLYVYVQGSFAVLYYLPKEGEMLASVGDVAGRAEERVKFYDNEVSPNWLSANAIRSWPDALVCIEEFCSNFSRSKALEWRRLS